MSNLDTYPSTIPFWKTHAFWTAVIAFLANITGKIAAEDQAILVDAVTAGIGAVVAIWAVWGRATQKAAPSLTVRDHSKEQ